MIVIEVSYRSVVDNQIRLPLLIERSRPRRQSVALWWRGAARHRGRPRQPTSCNAPLGRLQEARAWSKPMQACPKLAAVPRTTCDRVRCAPAVALLAFAQPGGERVGRRRHPEVPAPALASAVWRRLSLSAAA